MQRLKAHSFARRSVKWITSGVRRSSEKWWMGGYLSFITELCKDSEPVASKLLMKVWQFRYCTGGSYLLFLNSLGLYIHPEVGAFSRNDFHHYCSFLFFTLARPLEDKEEDLVLMGFWSYLHLSLPPLRNLPVLISSPVGTHKHMYAKIKCLPLWQPVHREHRPSSNKTDLTGMPESHFWNGFVIMSNHG